jgi:excisionase family DNA binding protein
MGGSKNRRTIMEPIALTIRDTSKAAGFGKTTTYKLINEGKLTSIKIGRRTLVTVASIKALLGAKADNALTACSSAAQTEADQ